MKLGINERLKGKKLYKEVWKPVILLDSGESYEGLYEVSNMGRVRSLDREVIFSDGRKALYKGKVMNCNIAPDGYKYVKITKDKKAIRYRVHRLVAFAFVDGWFEDAQVDHINTNKEKNIWTNLRWVTPKENNNNELTLQHKKERIVTDETRKKLSEINKGEGNAMYGKTHTPEARKKISEARKGKPNESRRAMVRCIETGIVYPSITIASESNGNIDCSSIVKCCKGTRNSCGKHSITGEPLHWEYVVEEEVS